MRMLAGSVVIAISLLALAPTDAFAQQKGWVTRVAELEAKVEALEAALVGVQAILEFVRVESGPINGLTGPHWIFEGANIHVRSGSGSTHGLCVDDPDCARGRGLGNLVVGYNEGFPSQARLRRGMHNLVVGPEHQYLSSGGFVAGRHNAIWGAGASVSGGVENRALGENSSVCGGEFNVASGTGASVLGGRDNWASGEFASVSGGEENEASGPRSSVSGGRNNAAGALAASVSGGSGRIAPADDNWAAGSLLEPN